MSRRVRRRTLGGSLTGRRGGYWRGRRGVALVTTGSVGRARRRARKGRSEVAEGEQVWRIPRGKWIVTMEHKVSWGLLVDSVTSVIIVVVRTVSRRVHMYSTEYIAGDAHRQRFISYLSRFTFAIRRLVTADNRVQLYRGWEGVGVCSYRLINFWYTRRQANKSARKAIVVNRRGDRARGRGRCRRREHYGVLAYGERRARASLSGIETGNSLRRRREARRRFGGAMGKSAQRGLQVWLPDAMEGPTPVSALIHAATMVTAGVYRIARMSPRREYTEGIGAIVMVRGGMTARYAGTVGIVQSDRKRVIAYSTCSQLGYMFSGCGRSAYDAAMGHLGNHARYKGRLFRGAGSVIHGMGDEQDRRGRGGSRRFRPWTYGTIRIGSRSLIGIPYRTGFYSKDLRLERAYGSYDSIGHGVYGRRTLAARCTAFYSVRRRQRGFQGEAGGKRKTYEGRGEAPRKMALAIGRLGIGAVRGGWRTKDRRLGMGTSYWGQGRVIHGDGRGRREAEERPRRWKRLPIVLAFSVAGIARRSYDTKGRERYEWKRQLKGRYTFRSKKWYIDKRYVEIAAAIVESGHEQTFRGRDRGRYERRGGSGLGERRQRRATETKAMHTGERKVYMAWLVKGRRMRRRRREVLNI